MASPHSDNAPGSISLGVLILGAGASSRMGRPKLLLPWSESTILGHLLGQWTRLAAEQIAIVLACPGSPITAELDRLSFPVKNRIFNPHSAGGMFTSIQAAAAWPAWGSGLSHVAIVLGDQPHLRDESLERVIAFASIHREMISQPTRAKRPRHPVIIPRAVFLELAASTSPTLKDFLRERLSNIALIEMDDPGFDLDIDRPEDYEEAIRLAQSASVNTPFQSTR